MDAITTDVEGAVSASIFALASTGGDVPLCGVFMCEPFDLHKRLFSLGCGASPTENVLHLSALAGHGTMEVGKEVYAACGEGNVPVAQ